MKKLLVIVLGWYVSTLGMEQKTYIELLPQELRQEISRFTTNLSNVFTIDELLQKLKEAAERSSSSSFTQALNTLQQQLEQIKNANYDNALAALQDLSKDKELEFLFNNLDFNRILIRELSIKDTSKELENIAQELNTPGALEYLRQKRFIAAATKGDIKAVKDFLDKGINVNARDINGRTALMIAVYDESKDIVEMLINAGADVNAHDKYGLTSLHWAAEKGHTNIVEMLIKAGADVNAKNNNGSTALHRAALGPKGIVQILLKAGVEVNSQNKYGRTALMLAVQYRRKDLVEILLASGADVNVKDNEGRTALHEAADTGAKDIVELLKKHGAKG